MQPIVDPSKINVHRTDLNEREVARIEAATLNPADFTVLEVSVLAQGMGWQDTPGKLVLLCQLYAGIPGTALRSKPTRMYDANGQLATNRDLQAALPLPGTVRVLVRRDAVVADDDNEES